VSDTLFIHVADFETSHEEVSWPLTLPQEIQNGPFSNRVY